MNRFALRHAQAWLIAAVALCAHAPQAHADETASQAARTPAERSQLTPSERAHVEQWDLTDSEWLRYKTLMQGIRGKLSPDISPIEALGIHARTDTERRYYAEMWAKALHDDTERVLAFQRAYDAAWKERYGNEPLIDLSHLAQSRFEALVRAGDRILFFAASGCPACAPVLEALLTKVTRTPNVGLDVYLVDSGNDDAKVRAWARDHRIPPELVGSRAVTLNHGNGTLARASGFTSAVPYLVRLRGSELTPITPQRLGVR